MYWLQFQLNNLYAMRRCSSPPHRTEHTQHLSIEIVMLMKHKKELQITWKRFMNCDTFITLGIMVGMMCMGARIAARYRNKNAFHDYDT